MIKNNTVYVVTMYRWGDRECHSYVLGVFSTKTKATKAGDIEQEYRGGNKYYPEILEIAVDTDMPRTVGHKTINTLEANPDFKRKIS